MTRQIPTVFLLFTLLMGATAMADDPSNDDDSGYLSNEQKQLDTVRVPVWFGMGVETGFGGNIITGPQGAHPADTGDTSYTATPFEDGGGGFAGGGGGFMELRFLSGHLGLRAGVFAERSRTIAKEKINGEAGNTYALRYSLARVPVLLTLYHLKKNHRFGLGLGPEVIFGLDGGALSIESDIDVSDNNKLITDVDLGVALKLGWGYKFNSWVAGLDIKTAYLVTYPRDYDKRVEARSGGYGILGAHSLDFRLLFQLMYELPIGKK